MCPNFWQPSAGPLMPPVLCRDGRPSRGGSAPAGSNPRLFDARERATLDTLSNTQLSVQERLDQADRAGQPQGDSGGAQLQAQQAQQAQQQQAISHSDNVPFPIWCAPLHRACCRSTGVQAVSRRAALLTELMQVMLSRLLACLCSTGTAAQPGCSSHACAASGSSAQRAGAAP